VNAAATSSLGKKKVHSCTSYLSEIIPDERAAAGGEGRQRRRVAARPWGKTRSLRGVVHHIRSMGRSTRYVMTLFLLIPRRCSCRDLRRLAQINPKLRTSGAPLLRGRVRAPDDNIFTKLGVERRAQAISQRAAPGPCHHAMKLSLAICFSSAGTACHHQMLAMDQDVRLGSRSKLSLPDLRCPSSSLSRRSA
jgi:hypothetical protein